MKHVRPNQPLRIKASDWNQIVDTVRKSRVEGDPEVDRSGRTWYFAKIVSSTPLGGSGDKWDYKVKLQDVAGGDPHDGLADAVPQEFFARNAAERVALAGYDPAEVDSIKAIPNNAIVHGCFGRVDGRDRFVFCSQNEPVCP